MSTIEKVAIDKLFRIDGDVAMITGAGDGFGRIAALALAGAGAHVAVTDMNMDSAERVVGEIAEAGGTAQAFHLDVSDRAAIADITAAIIRKFGGIHVLINNAGTGRRGPAEELSDDDWDAVVEINMTAPFICSREAGRHMLAAGRGRIINIASIMGFVGNPVFPHLPYQATKGALVNMTRALAAEWAGRGVRVNAIAPCFFKTNFGSRIWQDPERAKSVIDRTPWAASANLRSSPAASSTSPARRPRWSPATRWRSTAAGWRSNPPSAPVATARRRGHRHWPCAPSRTAGPTAD